MLPFWPKNCILTFKKTDIFHSGQELDFDPCGSLPTRDGVCCCDFYLCSFLGDVVSVNNAHFWLRLFAEGISLGNLPWEEL